MNALGNRRGLYLCITNDEYYRLVVENPACLFALEEKTGQAIFLADWDGLLDLAGGSELVDARYYAGFLTFFQRLATGVSVLVEGELGYDPALWSLNPTFFASDVVTSVWTRDAAAKLLKQLDTTPWQFVNRLSVSGFGQ